MLIFLFEFIILICISSVCNLLFNKKLHDSYVVPW